METGRMETDPQQRETANAHIDGLLVQVAAGNRAAFEQLYRATAGPLLGVCLRVLPDRLEAEDVLQEVFVAAWNKANQFDVQRSRGMTWLAAIARHRAIDRLRGMPALSVQAPIELAESTPDPAPAPAANAEADAERSRLDECLRRLDSRRRTLIHSAFFDGSTYEELARRCGSPLGSVKSWIRRGLLQLRTCLEA
jgi:RNA polymerase sigma-70 factor, ECF subfamily